MRPLSEYVQSDNTVFPIQDDCGEDENHDATSIVKLGRSISFSSSGLQEIRRIESLEDLAQSKGDLWFNKHELKNFCQSELVRREKLNIKSASALCDKPYEEVKLIYPRGVRR